MSLFPCDFTGNTVTGECPPTWSWDQTTCRCVHPTFPDVPGNPLEPGRACTGCLRSGYEIVPKVGGVCPDGFIVHRSADPYPTGTLCNFGNDCIRPVNPVTGLQDEEYNWSTHPHGPWGTCGFLVYWWCPPPINGTVDYPSPSAICGTVDCPEPYEWDRWASICAPPDCPPGECWDEVTQGCIPCEGGEEGAGEQPFNLRSHFGWYYRAFIADDTPKVSRARGLSTPPFDLTATVHSGTPATRPVLAEDYRERLHYLWEREETVYHATSDDDAETWTDPVSLWSDAKHPIVREDPASRALLAAARVSGNVETRIRYPGDSDWRASVVLQVSGVDLAIEDEAFGMEWMGDGQGRVVFAVRKSGETAIREFVSFDDGATCEEVT